MDVVEAEGQYAQSLSMLTGQDVNATDSGKSVPEDIHQLMLALKNVRYAHLLLEANAHGCAHHLQKARRTAVFASLHVVKILMHPPRVGEGYRAATYGAL